MSRLNYIHYFRAVAILFIVAGHSIDIFEWQGIGDLERFFRISMSNGSALFVFIAGYLFQHLIGKFKLKNYYLNKLTNVLVPYLIISIPAIILFVFFMQRPNFGEDFYSKSQLEQILYFLITGYHLAPLWFVPMISLFYIIAPLLKRLDDSKYFYYFIPLMILTSCLVSRGMPYQSFVHFFSLYVLGMFFSRYKDQVNPVISRQSFIAATVFLVLTFAALEYFFMKGTMTYLNYLQKVCMSVMFLGVLIKFNDFLESKFISKVADYSFGVFFIHSYIISSGKLVYEKINGQLPSFNFIAYIICIVLVFLACLLIVDLIKLLFKSRSKYIVGS